MREIALGPRKRHSRWERHLPVALYALAAALGLAAVGLGAWSLRIGHRYNDQLARAARVQAEVLARDFAESFRLLSDSSASRIFGPLIAGGDWDRDVAERLDDAIQDAAACKCVPVPLATNGIFFWSSAEPGRVTFHGRDSTRAASLLATLVRAGTWLQADGALVAQLKVDDNGEEIFAPTLVVREGKQSHVAGYLTDPVEFARLLFEPVVRRVQQNRLGDAAPSIVGWRFIAPGGATTLSIGDYRNTDPSVSLAFYRAPLRTDGGEAGASFLIPAISPTVPNPGDKLNWATDPRNTPYRLVVQVHPAAMGEFLYGSGEGPAWTIVAILVVTLVLAAATLALARRFVRQVREREAFAAAVAHDLRTPLTQILLYAESLQLDRPAVRTREAAAGVIVRETRRLIHLVENAMQFVRFGRSRPLIPLSPLVLMDAVEEIVDGLQPIFEKQGMQLEIAARQSPVVCANREALEQVVRNVLDNAVRFGQQGQTITIGVDARSAEATLSVDDQGPGIPPAMRRRVFEPFVHGGSSPGTGIGLSVSDQLMHAMNGSMRIESSSSGGARVILTFANWSDGASTLALQHAQ